MCIRDSLDSGRAWDLTRKNGGLNIVPPFAEEQVKVYTGRVEGLARDVYKRQVHSGLFGTEPGMENKEFREEFLRGYFVFL